MKLGKIRTIFISGLLLASLLMSSTAYAQDEELADPGITPDSPLYFIDTWGKSISMFFAFGPEAKVSKAMDYAEERLSEAQAMAAKNKFREMARAANDYDGFMAMINERLEAMQEGASGNISENVALNTGRFHSFLDKLKDRLPQKLQKDVESASDNESDAASSNETAEAIARARSATTNTYMQTIRILAKIKLERALEINEAAMKSRLHRADVTATENATDEVEEVLEDIDKLAEIEEEISDLAQALGDNTTLALRLAHSTANRLEVLARVYDKVPEKARTAIAGALENSVAKYERALNKLQEENGEIPADNVTALESIKEKIRNRLEQNVSGQDSDNTTSREKIQIKINEKIKERMSNIRPGKPASPGSDNVVEEANEAEVQTQSP